ncbi:RNA polymerase sigma factor [Novibacillus thermophilus]|uniref:RNA polymerase sigma factor n=1 Tax=Novibacillus thermophilus TaxID=1471761 RepID=UPI001E5BE0DF|nr:sigma factor-like helix-turn-helix DNA-binding protein [Novibacillus thermophilus]
MEHLYYWIKQLYFRNSGLDKESVERIIQAINSLRPQYRLAIILRGIEGLSTAQVAEILNWSEAKVKTTLHRARHSEKREASAPQLLNKLRTNV